MLVSVERDRRDAFYRYVREGNNVIQANELAGRFTALLEVSCPDMGVALLGYSGAREI